MDLSIEAFHGTSLLAAKSILQEGYRESDSDREWLGRGIYFFVEGISDPIENAAEWAKAEAYDKWTGGNKYKEIAVLKSIVEIDSSKIIDLTTINGLANFDILKNRVFDRIYAGKTQKELKKLKPEQHNCILYNFFMDDMDLHAIKHNLYIKHRVERIMNLKLNVPNSTVLCVRRFNFRFNAEIIRTEVIS